jgi:hypothetical protein
MSDLTERLNDERDYAPGWRPDEEPDLIYTMTGRTTRDGKFGPYPIDEGEREDGTRVAVHRTASILRADLEPAKIGDRVGIRYLGRHSTKGYHRFRVVIEPANEPGEAAVE